MSVAEIAIPPVDLRLMVGPVTDTSVFENPTGAPIYQRLGIPSDAYESVFDFGCGCGRVARQLLLQTPKPRRYVGIDPHPAMVDWCKNNLTTVNGSFTFFHHDVYSPWYADSNSLRLSEPFPVEDDAFSLIIAHSVFTHLCRTQTEYYLGEIARILKVGGVAYTTWLFFDRISFPFLSEGPYCLYTSEQTFSQAVIYDRRWFLSAVRAVGLRVRATNRPEVCGHQWEVLLERRDGNESDEFPIGEEAAEWVCGATYKQMAATSARASGEVAPIKHRPSPPKLFPVLAELKELRWRVGSMEGSWAWRLGRVLTAPVRALRSVSRA